MWASCPGERAGLWGHPAELTSSQASNGAKPFSAQKHTGFCLDLLNLVELPKTPRYETSRHSNVTADPRPFDTRCRTVHGQRQRVAAEGLLSRLARVVPDTSRYRDVPATAPRVRFGGGQQGQRVPLPCGAVASWQ